MTNEVLIGSFVWAGAVFATAMMAVVCAIALFVWLAGSPRLRGR